MKVSSKAEAIDLKKDKIILAGLTLFVGFMTLALLSSKLHANEPEKAKKDPQWLPHAQGEGEVKIPFQLKTQKLDH